MAHIHNSGAWFRWKITHKLWVGLGSGNHQAKSLCWHSIVISNNSINISILNSKALIIVSYTYGRAIILLPRWWHPSADRWLQHQPSTLPRVCPPKIGVWSQPFQKCCHSCSQRRRCVVQASVLLNMFNHCPFFPALLLPSREPASSLARTLKSHGRNLQCPVVHLSMSCGTSFNVLWYIFQWELTSHSHASQVLFK